MVDLCDLSREVASLIQREVKAAGVVLELDCDKETPKVLGVRDHLHQVLLNLLLNAVHATPEGGTIRLGVTPDARYGNEVASLVVEDSGGGIPEEHLERIFDPFFTTKDPDKGTGLGLMISHQIVADHGGSVEVRSEVGRGSSFEIRLPAGGGQHTVPPASA